MWGCGLLAVAFMVLQFVRPTLDNTPVGAEVDVPAEVRSVLRKGCYDCHSYETRLAWFDQIVPAYWMVRHDVLTARKHLNFSTLGALSRSKQNAALFEAYSHLSKGEMPLPAYRALHPEAALSEAERQVLRDYLSTQVASPSNATETQPAPVGHSVVSAPNGVTFPTDYASWKVVNISDRWDNGTLRIIAGNPVAIAAIEQRHTNPWPKGTQLGKIAWRRRADGGAGEFGHAEFMMKGPDGWQYARWVGTELKPYGSDAGFDQECIDCHRPVRNLDWVFTIPLPRRPELNGTWSAPSVEGSWIAVLIDGATLRWPEREEPHWYGARIPAF